MANNALTHTSEFTVRPLRKVEDEVLAADASTAEFWGVYRKQQDGLERWVSDHATKADALLEMTDMERIARRFVSDLREYLSDDKLKEIAQLNRENPDKSICHTHDFCDANVVMAEAFHAVMGREVPALIGAPQNDFDDALFDGAWSKAKVMIQSQYPA